MQTEITPEQVDEIVKIFGDHILSTLTLDQILSRYNKDEVLSRYDKEEVLSRYELKDRLKGVKPEELKAFLFQLEQDGK